MGLRHMAFATFPFGISACGIEISQRRPGETICPGKICQHPFHEQFGFTVRVDGGGRQIFRDGTTFRDTVNRCRAGDHDIPYPRAPHGFQDAQGPGDIVVDVLSGIAHGFSHLGERCKVDDAFRLPFCETSFQPFRIKDIPFYQIAPFDEAAKTGGKVIIDAHLMPGTRQSFAGMAADIAGPTCHQYFHDRTPAGRILVSKTFRASAMALSISQ